MRVRQALDGVVRLFLDTAPVIYFLEGSAAFQDTADAVMREVSAGSVAAVTSPGSLAECCAWPPRNGDHLLTQRYTDLIVAGNNTVFEPIDEGIAMLAADVRGRYRLRLPDALQIAVAIRSGCDAFLTNDADLKCVTEIPILVLSELEA